MRKVPRLKGPVFCPEYFVINRVAQLGGARYVAPEFRMDQNGTELGGA
jgi:hypothetical protein